MTQTIPIRPPGFDDVSIDEQFDRRKERACMPEPIHGHEVMRMMIESGKVYTRDSLRADIVERFGAEARFYTCSADNMTADELIAFLQARGKFLDDDGGFKTDARKICDH